MSKSIDSTEKEVLEKYQVIQGFLGRPEEQFTVKKIHPFDLWAMTVDGKEHNIIPMDDQGGLCLLDGEAHYQTSLTEAKTKDIA